jgi:hypothetical protein
MQPFSKQPIRRVEHSALRAPNTKMWSHDVPMFALPKKRLFFVEDDGGGRSESATPAGMV